VTRAATGRIAWPIVLEWGAKLLALVLLGGIIFLEVVSIRAWLGVAAVSPWRGWTRIVSDGSLAVFAAIVLAVYVVRRPAVRKAGGVLPRVAAVAGPIILPVALFFVKPDATPARFVAGTVLSGVGHVLSIAAIAWLGRSFSVMPEARKLVTSGPYAIVRHPLYLSEACASVGLVLLRFSWLSVAAFAVWTAAQFARARYEERVLSAEFPEYAAYAARTPMLLPWPRRRRRA